MKKLLIVIVLVCGWLGFVNAQQILLDKPVRAGELTLFPAIKLGKNEAQFSEYYYLPNQPRLARHPDGKPKFSFTRYVDNQSDENATNGGIARSNVGGGIVHVLVELLVTDEQISEAEKALQRLNSDAKIVGPVIFKSGNIALVSSVANAEGEMAEQVVGLGSAPVLENQDAAVSVQLNQLGSKLLWEMFTQTTTPDLSFSFEMQVEGYLSPKEVIIEADFERIYANHTIDAAARTPVLAAEIKLAFEKLVDEGAIKVTQLGTDADLKEAKDKAYESLTKLMFDEVAGADIPGLGQLVSDGEKSMLDRVSTMLDSARTQAKRENLRIEKLQRGQAQKETKAKETARERANRTRTEAGEPAIELPEGEQKKSTDSEEEVGDDKPVSYEMPKKVKVPKYAIGVSYKLRRIKRKGKYRINLNKYTETTMPLRFDYNIGNLSSECSDCFLEINLDDPLMKQRQVTVSLDLNSSDDFDYINSVNLLLKKEHQNGESTIDEIGIDKSKFNEIANIVKLNYGWKGDEDRELWLAYDYNIIWSFKGGHQAESGWNSTLNSIIPALPPVVKKPVYIEVDPDFVNNENVRGIEVKLFTQIGDRTETKVTSLKTQQEELSQSIEILIPRDVENYEYQIVYFVKGQTPRESDMFTTGYRRIDIDQFQ